MSQTKEHVYKENKIEEAKYFVVKTTPTMMLKDMAHALADTPEDFDMIYDQLLERSEE